MSGLLRFEPRPVGALTKAEAVAYVGGPDFFRELEQGFGLCPCRKKQTRVLYRVAELDRVLEAAEREMRGGGENDQEQP